MQDILNTVTAEQIRKCYQCNNWLNSTSYFEIWLGNEKKYTVFSDGGFEFSCTCGREYCEHVLWSIATAHEIKRISKLNPATITITKRSPLQFMEMIYTSDRYTVFYHPDMNTYRCSCPMGRSNRMNFVDKDCAHEIAVKRENNK